MNKRGPKKTPTAILKLRGTPRAKTRRREPKPNLGEPACPRGLSAKAKTIWRNLTPKLLTAEILTVVDGAGLVRFCELYVLWREALAELRGAKRIIEQANGVKSANPLFKIVNDLSRELARLEQAYGLTPADRAGLSVNKDALNETEDEERFFGSTA